MSKDREVSILVDAKNKSKGTFLEVKKDLRGLGEESEKGLGRLSKSFANADKVIFSFADKLQWMDKIAKRTFQGAAGAASIYVGATLRDFSQLNDGISKVNTLYEQTGESQKKMYQDSIKMFKMLPTDFNKITQGVYDTISAGADSKDATRMARKFGMAGVAGDSDMDVVTKAAMGTMNAYKLEAKDLTGILDLQFMTVKRGITSYSELASSLGTGVLASAKGSGISLQELYGSIAMITKNAIPANIATTSLNQLFNKFTDTKAIKEFKTFGVEIQDVNKNTRPLIEILKDLNVEFDKKGMSSESRKGYLKTLLGSDEAARAILPLLGDLKEFQSILGDMDNSSGAMRDAYDDRLDSMKTQISMFWNNLKGSGVEQVYTLEPLMKAFMEPTLKRQKLELDILELEEAMELEKDPMMKEMYLEVIAEVQANLEKVELAPVEELREALAQSVKELEKFNPPLAKFLDTIGNFTLNFVGEEGADNRKKAGNVAKGVAGAYITKKAIDTIAWYNKNFKFIGEWFKKGNKDTPETNIPGTNAENLTKTLKTMNVNANIVNVYGKSINNMGDGRIPGFPKGTPTIIPTTSPVPLPPGGAIPLPPATNPIPLPPAGGSLVAAETAAAVTGAVSMALPLILAATGGFVYYNYKHMGPNEELVKVLDEQAKMHPAHQRYKNAYTGDLGLADANKNKSPNTPDKDQMKSVVNLMNTKLMDELLKINKIQDKIDNTINLESKINVEPPKVDVSAKVYIDGKNIPHQKVEFDYRKVDKHFETQARRHGKPQRMLG